MSYIVSVEREEGVLSAAEIEELAAQDSALSFSPGVGDASGGDLEWRPPAGGEPRSFTLEGGKLMTLSTPSNAELEKLGEIAAALDAQVVGEEGERIDTAGVPDMEEEPPGCGCVLYPLALMGFIAFVYWYFN